MKSSVTHLSDLRTTAKSALSEMEPAVCDAAHFSTALAMALQGMNKLAVEPGHETMALERLADEARFAAHKARELWYEHQKELAGES